MTTTKPIHETATLYVEVTATLFPGQNRDQLAAWTATLGAWDGGDTYTTMGDADLYIADARHPSPAGLMDTDEVDLTAFLPLFGDDGYLREDLADLPLNLLIAEQVQIKPEYRGFGYGPLLLAEALTELTAQWVGGVIALHPSAYEVVGDAAERAAADARLRKLWTAFGCRRWKRTDLYLIDASTTTLEKARERARARVYGAAAAEPDVELSIRGAGARLQGE